MGTTKAKTHPLAEVWVPTPTVEVRIYKLRKGGEINYAGRAELPLERAEICDTVGASSRLHTTRVRAVRIGERLYKLEKEAGRPAIFLPPGDAPPKGML